MDRRNWRDDARFNFYGFERGIGYDEFVGRAAWLLGMPAERLPLFLTPAQVAQVMDEDEAFVLACIDAGAIPADDVNGRLLVCRDLMFPGGAPEPAPAMVE